MSDVKQVVWSSEYVAVITKHGMGVFDHNLHQMCMVDESQHIKSAVWSSQGVLLYSTLSQIKYVLVSGERGVVRSTEEVLYLVGIRNRMVVAFNREAKLVRLEINPSEFIFKVGKWMMMVM